MHEGAAQWLIWLENSALGLAMRRSLWLYPAAEIVHILGIVLLVGGALMFDLRLLGFSRGLSVVQSADHSLPWSRRGFALVVLSGAMMFAAHPTEWAYSRVFQVKLALIALALANAAVFHRGIFRSVATWDRDLPHPRSARLAGVVSLAALGNRDCLRPPARIPLNSEAWENVMREGALSTC